MKGFRLALGVWGWILAMLSGGAALASASTPSTSAVLVKDLIPGTPGLNFRSWAALDGRLYFLASGQWRTGLWRSDGTEEGTVLLKELWSFEEHSDDKQALVVMDGALYFIAEDVTSGIEVWKSDGTPEGTMPLTDVNSSGSSSSLGQLTVAGRTLFFRNDYLLWKSDGTPEGTLRLHEGVGVLSIVPLGGRVFFKGYPIGGGADQLWTSDGTRTGTLVLTTFGSSPTNPSWLTPSNGTLFFAADDNGFSGVELWKSNGTRAGTQRVKDIIPGFGSSLPLRLTDVNGTLFFTLDNAHGHMELWKSDGSEQGTVRVKDIAPLGSRSYPDKLTNVNGTLFLVIGDNPNTHGRELWKSDGTEAGTRLVRDIYPGEGDSFANHLTAANGAVFFSAGDDSGNGLELWKSDGTEEGTRLVASVYPGSTSSYPRPLLAIGDMLYFIADDGVHGQELWRMPLTPAGDVAPPRISCPGALTVEASSTAGATVRYTPARAADDVTDQPPVEYAPPNDTVLPLATTTVTASTQDEAGHTASCTFDVTVRDTTPPRLSCPADVTVEASSATGSEVSYGAASAEDTVSGERVTLAYSKPSGSRFTLGSHPLTVTAKDEAGNTSTCTFTVVVRDTTPPSVVCPSDLVAEALDGSGLELPLSVAPPRDAVTASPEVSFSPLSGSRFPLGTTAVTVTTWDAARNFASCSFSVTVRDTTPPQLTCPADVSVDSTSASGRVVDYSAPVATDSVSSSVDLQATSASGSRFPIGHTSVEVKATDASGNVSQCSFRVSVKKEPGALGCSTTSAGGSAFGWSALLLLLGWGTALRRRPGGGYRQGSPWRWLDTR